jgi:hypothetical protein
MHIVTARRARRRVAWFVRSVVLFSVVRPLLVVVYGMPPEALLLSELSFVCVERPRCHLRTARAVHARAPSASVGLAVL